MYWRNVKVLCYCFSCSITNTIIFIMSSKYNPDQTPYNPNYLLDELIAKLDLKNDAALSRVLEVAPPVISKIRHHTLPIGATILIRMHEVSDFSIRELKEMLAYQESPTAAQEKLAA